MADVDPERVGDHGALDDEQRSLMVEPRRPPGEPGVQSIPYLRGRGPVSVGVGDGRRGDLAPSLGSAADELAAVLGRVATVRRADPRHRDGLTHHPVRAEPYPAPRPEDRPRGGRFEVRRSRRRGRPRHQDRSVSRRRGRKGHHPSAQQPERPRSRVRSLVRSSRPLRPSGTAAVRSGEDGTKTTRDAVRDSAQ